MKPKNIAKFLIVALATTSFIGCNSKVKQIKKEANKEKKVINLLYDIDGEYLREYTDCFNVQHQDIIINTILMPSTEAKKYLMDEKNRENIDIWLGNSIVDTEELSERGILHPYKPEGSEKIKEGFKDEENEVPTWTGISAYNIGVAKTKDLDINEDNLIDYLISNEAKGQFSMVNPKTSSAGYMFLKYIYDKYGEDQAIEIFQKIKENEPMIEDYSAKVAKNLHNEKCKVAITTDFDGLFSKWDDFNIDYFDINRYIYNIETLAIINKENVKPEAKIFADYMFSDLILKLQSRNRQILLDERQSQIEGAKETNLHMKNFKNNIEGKKQLIDLWTNVNRSS